MIYRSNRAEFVEENVYRQIEFLRLTSGALISKAPVRYFTIFFINIFFINLHTKRTVFIEPCKLLAFAK